MAAPPPSRLHLFAARLLGFLTQPSRGVEIVSWGLLIAAVVATRVYLAHLVPAYLWSKDAKGYALPAIQWLGTGLWENDPKRGPVYSLFIAFCLKLWGNFDALVTLQHVLGSLGLLVVVFYLRVMWGKAAHWPAMACGLALATYGKLLYMEHLIRNDWMLFLFAAAAFMAFGLWFRSNVAGWLLVCGLGAGMLAITRNVLVPLPLFVLLALLWQCRQTLKSAVRPGALFLLGLALPIVGAAVFRQVTIHNRPPQPQGGGNFFARVAQFTVLDGGIAPEIKELIREDVESYRAKGEFDSNEILNQTAVPRIRAHFESLGKTPTDADRLCMRLAIEAIRAHPGEYAQQFARDFQQVQLELGAWDTEPAPGDIRGACRSLRNQEPWPQLRVEDTIRRLEPVADGGHLKDYRRLNRRAWLFAGSPVLYTSIGVTLLALLRRGKMKLWWLTAAATWWFMMVLLCTVGRPLGRYLLPVVPIMFWTLGSLVAMTWIWLLHWLKRFPLQNDPATSSVAPVI